MNNKNADCSTTSRTTSMLTYMTFRTRRREEESSQCSGVVFLKLLRHILEFLFWAGLSSILTDLWAKYEHPDICIDWSRFHHQKLHFRWKSKYTEQLLPLWAVPTLPEIISEPHSIYIIINGVYREWDVAKITRCLTLAVKPYIAQMDTDLF